MITYVGRAYVSLWNNFYTDTGPHIKNMMVEYDYTKCCLFVTYKGDKWKVRSVNFESHGRTVEYEVVIDKKTGLPVIVPE